MYHKLLKNIKIIQVRFVYKLSKTVPNLLLRIKKQINMS